MKIGIVGKGYWGNIIFNNLMVLGYTDILTYDINIKNSIKMENLLECDNIFICTPLKTHFDICKFFLSHNKRVFCEKPLVDNLNQCIDLYNNCNDKNLFVNWIFLFNESVNFIKNLTHSKKYGELKSISMNRLNYGPIRLDTDSRFDLSCHDVSILYYILEKFPDKTFWLNYKRNFNSLQNDSATAFFKFGNIFAHINSSWHYGKKDRNCIFEFESGFLQWDDANKILKFNDNQNLFAEEKTPLQNSIINFITKNYDFEFQKTITENVIKILTYENTF